MTEIIKVIDILPDEAKHLAQKLHRKKEDIEIYRKSLIGEVESSSDEDRTLVARVSTNDRDRDGEIVEPKGIDLKDYLSNPVLMWAHSYSTPPVGKALWSKTDDKGLVCKFQFAKTQFADEIYTLYRDGYLKAFSIGFIPTDFDSKEKVHKRISLLEVSCVPVPANQSALVMEAYAKGLVTSEGLKHDLGIEEPVQESAVFKEPEQTEKVNAAIVNKPETTDDYHRIPVSDGHGDHKIRTIDVTDGVKALYCVDCKEIATYLFDVDKFTMEEAQAWVEEHKKGVVIGETKNSENDEIVYTAQFSTGEVVIHSPLIEKALDLKGNPSVYDIFGALYRALDPEADTRPYDQLPAIMRNVADLYPVTYPDGWAVICEWEPNQAARFLLYKYRYADGVATLAENPTEVEAGYVRKEWGEKRKTDDLTARLDAISAQLIDLAAEVTKEAPAPEPVPAPAEIKADTPEAKSVIEHINITSPVKSEAAQLLDFIKSHDFRDLIRLEIDKAIGRVR